MARLEIQSSEGSSPRGRGKREPGADHLRRSRLIPAWAGKTAVLDSGKRKA